MNIGFFLDKANGFVFIGTATVCFLCDIVAFGYIGWPMLQAVLALYTVQILSATTELRLMLLAFLLLLESCIMYDSLVVLLGYALIIMLFGAYARYMLYPGLLQKVTFGSCSVIVQFFVESYVLGLVFPFCYLVARLVAYLIALMLLS